MTSGADIANWFNTPQGLYIRRWEEDQARRVAVDLFGYYALQLGMPCLDLLAASRIPCKKQVLIHNDACVTDGAGVRCHQGYLPFAANSVDLVVLPHVLEFSDEPHQVLREVERVLVPEGVLLLYGFNPFSMWGLWHLGSRRDDFPWSGRLYTVSRLKDWLSLLGLELDRGVFGCYAPPFRQEQWLKRCQFIEHVGERWWAFAGSVYLLRAIKRVRGMHLIGTPWCKQPEKAGVLSPAACQPEAQSLPVVCESSQHD